MVVVKGIDWVLSCTSEYESTIIFVRDVLGLEIVEQGVPRIDTHFARYARAVLPNDTTLEIVEPVESATDFLGQQIICFTVDDLLRARAELEQRQVTFISGIIDDGQGWGWTYLRAPDGNIYQLQGSTGVQHVSSDTTRAG